MHHHTMEFKIQKYKDSSSTAPLSQAYKAYLTPNYSTKILADVGPFNSLDELAKELATRGNKKSTYKFIPFTKPQKQIVQVDYQGKKYVESTISTDELEELVKLFYKYKFKNKS